MKKISPLEDFGANVVKQREVGTVELLPPAEKDSHFVFLSPSNIESFVLELLERPGKKRNSEERSCRPCVFQVCEQRPSKTRHS